MQKSAAFMIPVELHYQIGEFAHQSRSSVSKETMTAIKKVTSAGYVDFDGWVQPTGQSVRRLSVLMPVDLHHELKECAHQNRVPMTAVVIEAIRKHIGAPDGR